MKRTPQKKPHLKELVVEIVTMNAFSYAVAAPIELIVAGLTLEQHVRVRLVALVLNTILARPYGLWRTYLFRKTCIGTKSPFLHKYLGDTLVFLSFQLPLYIGNMLIGGAGTASIIKVALTATAVSGLLGRPYGMCLDFVRTRFHLGIEYHTGRRKQPCTTKSSTTR